MSGSRVDFESNNEYSFLGGPEWREIADFGTFPDLNHLLEGVERS